MKYRTEFDSIGKIKVPEDKYWGASTERSNKYFNIGDFLVRPLVIHSIGIILLKLEPNNYLIFSYRSFFDSFYAWVIDSAKEYGYALS